MCKKIVIESDYISYLRKQRDKYIKLHIQELVKGRDNKYVTYFANLYSTLVVQYENIVNYFGDLRFYLKCMKINERRSIRFKKLYQVFKNYRYSYLMDILNNKRYEVLKEILYA